MSVAAKEVESKFGRHASTLRWPYRSIHATSSWTSLTDPTRLDGLVNNAAIADVSTNGTPGQKMSQTFATNTTGPLLMVDAFAPLLKKSLDIARVVNVTSGAGSISMDLDPQAMGYAMKTVEYRASKAVLNMISACQAVEHGREELKLFLFNPEFTVSSLGPYDKKEYGAKPTSEGAEPVVKILRGKREKDHGGFLHANGQHPW